MKRTREINVFSIAFLDLLSGALGAVIILFIAVPKAKNQIKEKEISPIVKTQEKAKERKVANTQSDEKEKRLEKILGQQNIIIKELKDDLKKNNQEIEQVKNENQELQSSNKKLSKQNKMSNALNKYSPSLNSQKPIDVGFKFKGKRILFIIDVSGSMVQEERISHVKAGLKMLITSMSRDFRIDVVSFPAASGNKSYKELWGSLKNTTQENKLNIFEYLYSLRPTGRTPTRSVLRFAFKNYYDLSDIVLLTDGVPTKTNSGNPDDIYSMLAEVAQLNKSAIQINAIGVGSDFIRKKENKAYTFLDRLTRENNGFFVGF